MGFIQERKIKEPRSDARKGSLIGARAKEPPRRKNSRMSTKNYEDWDFKQFSKIWLSRCANLAKNMQISKGSNVIGATRDGAPDAVECIRFSLQLFSRHTAVAYQVFQKIQINFRWILLPRWELFIKKFKRWLRSWRSIGNGMKNFEELLIKSTELWKNWKIIKSSWRFSIGQRKLIDHIVNSCRLDQKWRKFLKFSRGFWDFLIKMMKIWKNLDEKLTFA